MYIVTQFSQATSCNLVLHNLDTKNTWYENLQLQIYSINKMHILSFVVQNNLIDILYFIKNNRSAGTWGFARIF